MRVLFVIFFCCFFFFKQKTAYEMRISDWSSDVCSSDLPIGKAAELVGRTAAAIREAEKDGRLPPPPRTENNRRVGYTLAQLNDMRGLFGTRPWRSADDPCCVMAVQNFKGGVGKSTLAVHLAHYLALQGYHVALTDCDSHTSATTLFAHLPDFYLPEHQHT